MAAKTIDIVCSRDTMEGLLTMAKQLHPPIIGYYVFYNRDGGGHYVYLHVYLEDDGTILPPYLGPRQRPVDWCAFADEVAEFSSMALSMAIIYNLTRSHDVTLGYYARLQRKLEVSFAAHAGEPSFAVARLDVFEYLCAISNSDLQRATPLHTRQRIDHDGQASIWGQLPRSTPNVNHLYDGWTVPAGNSDVESNWGEGYDDTVTVWNEIWREWGDNLPR